VDLTRFRRRCWGETKKEDPDARNPSTIPTGVPRRIVELARGRKIEELAREFEVSANSIRKWVKQAELDEGLRGDGLTSSEREELNRLRRENRVLREEREILSKAAAWCVSRTRA
jgi:transposase